MIKDTCIFWRKDHCKKDEGLSQWNQLMQGKPISKECPSKCMYFKPKIKGSLIEFIQNKEE